MVLQEFKIVLDNPDGTYHSEELLSGKIVVRLDSPRITRGIKLSIKGDALTKWDSYGYFGGKVHYVFMSGHEKLLKHHFYAFGSESGPEIELPAGTHTYPFQYALPPNLPSSFKSDNGRIRYKIKAILNRPWRFNHKTKTAFTLVSHLDLNKVPSALEQVNLNRYKTFCCLCCATEELAVNLRLPVRGYVPGEVIPIKVSIENLSGMRIGMVKHKLVKIVTYLATFPYTSKKIDKSVVSEVSRGPISDSEETNYDVNLDVPPLLPASFLNHCKIIDLEYELLTEACISKLCYENMRIRTKIFIGTVPLSRFNRHLR
ncbi:arrestin domain-containing protein 17-like [Copidosoma floridanum]|uniref:arrestin domain-containing protein 17-like n=1 Tax=Copidosoma floridanum TaxID=29053 RepID=UPI0006C971C4|nr:arrestin domain-containing protein 17-like [Copidosoma floridanum]